MDATKETRTLGELRAECRKAGIMYAHDAFKTGKDTPTLRIAGIYATVLGYPVVVVNVKVPPMIRRRILADALKVAATDPQRPKTEYWLDHNGRLTAQFNPNDYPAPKEHSDD